MALKAIVAIAKKDVKTCCLYQGDLLPIRAWSLTNADVCYIWIMAYRLFRHRKDEGRAAIAQF